MQSIFEVSRMMKSLFFATYMFAGVLFVLLAPLRVDAAGLVPCGTGNNPPCTLCHLVVGAKGVIDWGMSVMTFFAITIIVAMAIVYIVSAGDSGMMSTAKNGIKSTMIGFAVMLGSWVIVNTFMTVLANNSTTVGHADNWYTFTCDLASKTQQIDQVPQEPGITDPLSCSEGACAKNQEILNAIKKQSFMNPDEYMAILQAGEHYGQTSSCKKQVSPTGACGYSQVMPATASGVCGLSCAQIIADPVKDIACGARAAADFKRFTNTKCVDDKSKRISCTVDGIKSLAGCYNRGFHCNISPRNVGGKWYDCGEIQSGKSYCDRVSAYASSCKL